MINRAYRDIPGVCLVCGKDLPKNREKFCSITHQTVGRTKLTALQLRKMRGLVERNIRDTGKGRFTQVARVIGCNIHVVRWHWSQTLRRRAEAAALNKKALCTAKVEKIRSELLAEIRSWTQEDPQPPYKDADILTGQRSRLSAKSHA